MPDMPDANISLDIDWAIGKLNEFNASLLRLAADRMLWAMFQDPQQQWATDLVDAVDSLMRTRVPREHRRLIAQYVAANWAGIFGALADIQNDGLANDPQGTLGAVQPILSSLLQGLEGVDRQHYSFATKFIHWASRGSLPIVDALARQSIWQKQKAFHALGHDWVPESRVLRGPGQDRSEDYSTFVHFYSHLFRGLEGHREQLLEADRIAQHATAHDREEFVVQGNTLARVLDKVFWIAGAG